MYKASITNEELAELPSGAFKGEIVVVDTQQGLDDACEHLEKCIVIGFDTETRPSFKKGTLNEMALLQLSSETTAFLIRLHKIEISEKLIEIFENSKSIKVGASIRDDIKGIQKKAKFIPKGFIDIQSIVGNYGITDISVRKVSGIVLEIRVSKAQRLSNWEAQTLTPAQQLYAATDAWSCLEIYLKLTKNK